MDCGLQGKLKHLRTTIKNKVWKIKITRYSYPPLSFGFSFLCKWSQNMFSSLLSWPPWPSQPQLKHKQCKCQMNLKKASISKIQLVGKEELKNSLSTGPGRTFKYSTRPLHASWLGWILRTDGGASGLWSVLCSGHESFPCESDCDLPLLIQYWPTGELTATCLWVQGNGIADNPYSQIRETFILCVEFMLIFLVMGCHFLLSP